MIKAGRQALLSCIHFLEELSKKAKKIESKGLNHVEIRRELFGSEYPFAQMTSGQYTMENLIRAVLLMD